MISRIFRSVFFTTILVLILGLGASLFISSYQLIKADSDGLISFTTKLENAINKNPSLDLTLLEIDDYRVNLIHKDGHVYYDSKVDPSTLENHSDRDEFIQAEKTGKSRVYRYSSTLGQRTVYYAVRLNSGDVLRCAYTTENIFSQALSLGLHLLIILLLAIVVSVILAKRISAKIVSPINKIDLNNPADNVVYDELKPFLERIDSHQHRIKKLLRKVTDTTMRYYIIYH